MQDGRVSLVAKDATVRQILTEWARVGQTKIVNVERMPGGPVTLELTNVPEAQALDVLLRSLSGYIAAPRPVEAANLSRFDRIILMPTLAAARPADARRRRAPVFQQNPQFTAAAAGRRRRRRRPAPNVPVAVPGAARPGLQHVPAAAGREPAGRAAVPQPGAPAAAAPNGAGDRRRRPSRRTAASPYREWWRRRRSRSRGRYPGQVPAQGPVRRRRADPAVR